MLRRDAYPFTPKPAQRVAAAVRVGPVEPHQVHPLVRDLLAEWAYRGVLWAALQKRLGLVATWIVTSAAFGLSHLLMGPVSHVPEQIGIGLLFGWLRWKTGRLWPAILAHMPANALLISIV